ncbi:hypothetical protein J4E83_008250 [Alternaria metachromatica]|uniref:uncharacterized protein n=1 Tax=Alternaria metachromatica TaxID=283354 RepID=UPI0020C522DA|nr:uncharacterized protein J4E83_008250 [Alternaria metachromatica]KAI4610636.1 hypothetical protein J4E83_008250 [Alternaria metachromatica]
MDTASSAPPVQAANRTTGTMTVTTTTITKTVTTTTTVFTPFRFLDLPVELRIMVYEELVVVGKVFYTPDDYAVKTEKRFKDWKSYRAPQLAILRTCKQVHKEAEEVYLGKNLFVLPDESTRRQPLIGSGLCPNSISDYRTFTHIPFPDRWLFSASAPRLIKSVSIGFSGRSWQDLGDQSDMRLCSNFDSLAPAARLEFAHQTAKNSLNGELDGYIEDLHSYFKNGGGPILKRLDYIEFDLTNAFCPTGCCRMAKQEWPQFMLLGPKKTGFLGVIDKQEANIILTKVYNRLWGWEKDMHENFEGKLSGSKRKMTEAFGMVFNPKKTHWEQWKVNTKK